MVGLRLMGRPVEAAEGSDLLTACLAHGVAVPHFCWHEALGSVGACRLCAVHVTRPDGSTRIEMACMTPVAEGLEVDPGHADARAFRAQVIEWLLAAHPHDCAVCEAGGACHLQDMAVQSGHHRRRVRDPKRHHQRQDLGPLLTHEMNRCIACYRCSRFYQDFAGGRDFAVFGSQARIWFGRARPGPLDSPFAGNLAELCPTGVFNDAAWSAAYARPWDMERTPAICTRCAVGCNLTLHRRDGQIRKAEARFHGALNRHFLCDRGRFAAHAVHAPGRARDVPLEEARRLLAGGAIGLGSPHASLEANLALREFVGPERFFASVSDATLARWQRMLAHLAGSPARRASLADMARADAVLLLCEDLVAEAPMAALMLRQASRSKARARAAAKGIPAFLDEAVRTGGEGQRSPFFILSPGPTGLDDVAIAVARLPSRGMARRAAAILEALAGRPADAEAEAAAETLLAAHFPLVVATAGPATACLIDLAAAIAGQLGPKAGLALLPGEANAFGLSLLEPLGGWQAAKAAASAAGLPCLALEPGRLPQEWPVPLVRLDWLTEGPGLSVAVAAPEEAPGLFVNFEGRVQESHAALRGEAPWSPAVLAAISGAAPPTLLELRARLQALLPALARLPQPPAVPITRAAPGFSGRTASDAAGQRAKAVPPEVAAGETFGWGLEGGPPLAPAHRPDWTGDGLHSPSSSWRPALGGDAGGGVLLDLPIAPPGPAPELPLPDPVLLEAIPARDPFASGARDAASPWIAARLAAGPTAPPAPALHPEEAARRGLCEGMRIAVEGRAAAGPLALDEGLAQGVIRLDGRDMPHGERLVRVEAVP